MSPPPQLTEPAPIWPEAPRFCPQRPFPPYRFVPGLNPHPQENPENRLRTHIPPERWKENKFYLFGVDLYHQGYLWESHEVWETLWHLTDKEEAEGQFLQGLIQNSAAQLKIHLGEMLGGRHLSRESYRRLQFVSHSGVCDPKGSFMGLNLSELLKIMDLHYGELWKNKGGVAGPPPRLKVEL